MVRRRRPQIRIHRIQNRVVGCICLILIPPQVRLANIGGDVLAVGGMALDLLDSVEQVSDKS